MQFNTSARRAGLSTLCGVVVAVIAIAISPLAAVADEAPAEPVPTESVVVEAPAEATPEPGSAPPEPAPVDPATVDPAPADPAPAEPAPADPAPADPAEPTGDSTSIVSEAAIDEVLETIVEEPTLTLFAESPAPDAELMALALALPLALPVVGDPCFPAVCINNGTILLAVNPTGELNTNDATGSPAGPGNAGLTYLPTLNDATSPGCLCEGWGVADPATGTFGAANRATFGIGGSNITVESFVTTASTATSVVIVHPKGGGDSMRVTHDYFPSPATPNLYQVNVTIQNLTGDTIAVVQYRRVMDWDIEPTAFDEVVTIDGGTASALFQTTDDGFESSNPLTSAGGILNFSGNFVDSGPTDHGALFDFRFGPLAPGASLSFVTFYGAGATEAEANAALMAVGAEAYSFGQTSTDPIGGTPNTFIFAFGNVGGAPIFPIAPAVIVPPAVTASAVTASGGAALAATGIEASMLIQLALALALAGGLVLLIAARRREVEIG